MRACAISLGASNTRRAHDRLPGAPDRSRSRQCRRDPEREPRISRMIEDRCDHLEDTLAQLAEAGDRHTRRLPHRYGGLRDSFYLRPVPRTDDGRAGLEPRDLRAGSRHTEPPVGSRYARGGSDLRPLRPGRRIGRVRTRDLGYGLIRQRHQVAGHSGRCGRDRDSLHCLFPRSGGYGPGGGTGETLPGARTRDSCEFARTGSVLTDNPGLHRRFRLAYRLAPSRDDHPRYHSTGLRAPQHLGEEGRSGRRARPWARHSPRPAHTGDSYC